MWLVVAWSPSSISNFCRSDRAEPESPRHTPLPRQTQAARAMLRVIASLTGRRALASSSRIPRAGFASEDTPWRTVRYAAFERVGEGFRPARGPLEGEPTRDGPATDGDTSLASRARARGDCEKVVAVADCGHGVGRALVSALLEFPECRMVVAGATPSSELTTSLHMQHWAECDAMQLDVSRVDLADDAEVKAWKDRVEFTFGVPDVLITNCGELPSYWKLNYEAAETFCPNDNEVVVGGCRPLQDSTLHADANAWDDDTGDASSPSSSSSSSPPPPPTPVRPARVWETRAIDWSRMMNDVKGVSALVRHFTPAMVARGSGIVVNVTHVLDPPGGAEVAAYQASRAAISALTRCLSHEIARDLEVSATSRVIAVELNPGTLRGLRHEDPEADVGPLHRAHGDEAAQDWAHAAVPFVMNLTREVSGASLAVPGFGGGERERAASKARGAAGSIGGVAPGHVAPEGTTPARRLDLVRDFE